MLQTVKLTFKPIGNYSIASITINRPDKANAFNKTVIEEMLLALEAARSDQKTRLLIVNGAGKHFSSGADLAWMKESVKLSYLENIEEAQTLHRMFDALASFPRPTITVVQGAVYGGAVGLVAASDITIASSEARFCLSEVNVGLLPAVIVPFLSLKMSKGSIKRYALTGQPFSAKEASESGLVQIVTQNSQQIGEVLTKEINYLLSGGPNAQSAFKELFGNLLKSRQDSLKLTTEAIAKARTGDEGQKGLHSFFERTSPPWKSTLEMSDLIYD